MKNSEQKFHSEKPEFLRAVMTGTKLECPENFRERLERFPRFYSQLLWSIGTVLFEWLKLNNW